MKLLGWCLWVLVPTLTLCAPLDLLPVDAAPQEAEDLPTDPQELVLIPYHLSQDPDLTLFKLPTSCSPTTQQLIPTNPHGGAPSPAHGTLNSAPSWWVWVLYCNPNSPTAKPEAAATTPLPSVLATEATQLPSVIPELALPSDPQPKYLTDDAEIPAKAEASVPVVLEVSPESTVLPEATVPQSTAIPEVNTSDSTIIPEAPITETPVLTEVSSAESTAIPEAPSSDIPEIQEVLVPDTLATPETPIVEIPVVQNFPPIPEDPQTETPVIPESPVTVEVSDPAIPEAPSLDTVVLPDNVDVTTAPPTETLPGAAPAETLDPATATSHPISEAAPPPTPPTDPEHSAAETVTEQVVVLPVDQTQIPPPPIESFIYNTTVPLPEVVSIPHDPCLTAERTTTTTQTPIDPCATAAPSVVVAVEVPIPPATTEPPSVAIPEPETTAVAVTTPEPEPKLLPDLCGAANITGSQIVDGRDTPQRSWPWMAVLLYRNRRTGKISPACGGVLITDQHVLTAAHCCCLKNQLVQVRLGDHHNGDEKAVQVIAIGTIISHEKYNVWPHGNDIAILKLEQKVQINEKVQPICLPLNAEFHPDDIVGTKPFVAGWADGSEEWYALLEERKASTDVQLPVISLAQCEQSYKRNPIYKNYVFNSSVICTAYPDGGQDACQVDSGRPLMLPLGAGNRFHLLGVVTWGHGCGEPGYPGVYTSVPQYMDWIMTNLS